MLVESCLGSVFLLVQFEDISVAKLVIRFVAEESDQAIDRSFEWREHQTEALELFFWMSIWIRNVFAL